MNRPLVLVTGGAGYIGSHTVVALVKEGFRVVVLDNLVCGHRELLGAVSEAELVVGSSGDRHLLERLFTSRSFEAVLHFAAHAYVSESVGDPGKYYHNNVCQSLALFETMIGHGVKRCVFSSTCATYGIPDMVPIDESTVQAPVNPYGFTKLAVERMLSDFGHAHGLRYICFRYFNAAGADPLGRTGEKHDPEPHLIPRVLHCCLGREPEVPVCGTDYPTVDGSCVRDYVHVSDLADAHVLGLRYLLDGGASTCINLGTGTGYSVLDVIRTAEKVCSKAISVRETERRPGDPPVLVASPLLAGTVLNWRARRPSLEEMIADAWRWHSRHVSACAPVWR